MSIGIKVKTSFEQKRLHKVARNESLAPLRRAAGSIRLTAARSIRKRGKGKKSRPSDPGSPPKTFAGRLRRSILYDVDKPSLTAVIGPSRNIISTIGSTHEFGGEEKRRKSNFKIMVGGHGPIAFRNKGGKIGLVVVKIKTSKQAERSRTVASEYDRAISKKPIAKYAPRPFMRPALEKNASKIPSMWRGSVTKG
jgi:hypothetical protein